MKPTYLTETQMDELMTKCQDLRKGHKLFKGRKPYTVIVDEEYHDLGNIPALRRFLSACLFPSEYLVFRNMAKGVTVNLDQQ